MTHPSAGLLRRGLEQLNRAGEKKCVLCCSPLAETANFCSKCGTKQNDLLLHIEPIHYHASAGCQHCGGPESPDGAFCSQCGWYVKEPLLTDDVAIATVCDQRTYIYLRTDLPHQIFEVARVYDFFSLEMREINSASTRLPKLVDRIDRYLATNPWTHGQLQDLAYRIVDDLYFCASSVTVVDGHTNTYFENVVRHFFARLLGKGIKVFYILDNTMPRERAGAFDRLFDGAASMSLCPTWKTTLCRWVR